MGAAPAALLAVIVSLLMALALGQLPRSHPLIPALHFRLPGPATRSGSLSLPGSVPLGSKLMLHGRLPAGETGTITIEGAYGTAPWQVLATAPVEDGSYEAQIPLTQQGLLHLRVTYPDGHRSVGETEVG